MTDNTQPIPKGFWRVKDQLKDISKMDIEEIKAIVTDRRARNQFVHPLMLKRLGLPPEADKTRHKKSFRVQE